TRFIHGEEQLALALETTQKLFSGQQAAVEALSADDLENMEGIVKFSFPRETFLQNGDLINFLTETSIFPSKGEARKLIQNGGLSINRKKVETPQLTLDTSFLLHDKYLLIQKGKKNHYLVQLI